MINFRQLGKNELQEIYRSQSRVGYLIQDLGLGMMRNKSVTSIERSLCEDSVALSNRRLACLWCIARLRIWCIGYSGCVRLLLSWRRASVLSGLSLGLSRWSHRVRRVEQTCDI